jgi:surface carbohydrate biosynthesis protein
MKLFFWPIETSSREFQYKVDLAKKLECTNSLHIFARPWTLSYLALFCSKVNWIGQNVNHKFRINKKKLSSIIVKKGGRVFYFDEEGGFYYPEELAEKVLKHRYSNINPTELHHVFSWGSTQNKILSKMGFNCSDVGHPRFDKVPKETDRDDNFKNILIMTNFSLILSEKNFLNEFDDEYFPRRKAESIKDLAKLIMFISQQSKKKLLIRPHPSEDLMLYKKLFQHFDNVQVLEREPLKNALKRASKVYHFNCSTALDALTSGIETYNLSSGNSTIIKDLPTSLRQEINSEWLSFPSKKLQILDVISNQSVTRRSELKVWWVNILINFLELSYGLRSLIKGTYEQEKFGDMKSLNNGKTYHVIKAK